MFMLPSSLQKGHYYYDSFFSCNDKWIDVGNFPLQEVVKEKINDIKVGDSFLFSS